MLEDKIKFMEEFSMDRRLYWRIPDIYGRYDWEIIWHKKNAATPWQAKKVGVKNWLPMNHLTIPSELSKRNIDVEEFERQLTGNLLSQVVFCNTTINEAKSLLGDASVDLAISQHESFANELIQAIKRLEEQTLDTPKKRENKKMQTMPSSGSLESKLKTKSTNLRLISKDT